MHPRPLLPSPPCWSSQLCNSDEPAGRSCPATMAKACLAAADQGQISVDSQLPDGLRFPPQARAIAALIAIHPSGWCQSLPRSWSHSPPLLRGRSEGGRSGPGGHRQLVLVWSGRPRQLSVAATICRCFLNAEIMRYGSRNDKCARRLPRFNPQLLRWALRENSCPRPWQNVSARQQR